MSEDHVKSQGSFAVGRVEFAPLASNAAQGASLAGRVGKGPYRADERLMDMEAIVKQREVKELAKSLLPSIIQAGENANCGGAAKLAFDFAEAFMVEAEARVARVMTAAIAPLKAQE
jgi:hypothetical protein